MDNTQYLKEKAFQGLERKGFSSNQEYIDRLNYEIEIIEQLGFISYFLVMWDIVQFHRKEKIIYGPGRGSGCSSLLNFCLDITLIDPIKYNLYFERFMNPARASSIDLDSTQIVF